MTNNTARKAFVTINFEKIVPQQEDLAVYATKQHLFLLAQRPLSTLRTTSTPPSLPIPASQQQ